MKKAKQQSEHKAFKSLERPPCGKCLRPMTRGQYTLKCDEWHWHSLCWRRRFS